MKPILTINTSKFRTHSQEGFGLNNRSFAYDDPNVIDGFVYPAPDGTYYPQVNALAIPWTVNVGGAALAIDNPPQVTLPSGITLIKAVRRFTLFDQGGVMKPEYSPVQDGFIKSAGIGENCVDQAAANLAAGQFLNIDGLPYGYYTLLLESDPLHQWTDSNPTPGANPVRVQFRYAVGRIDILSISPEPLVPFPPAANTASLEARVAALERANRPGLT